MDEQDRAVWDRALIEEGNRVLARAASFETPGQYQLQAAIASVHANAVDAESTDWPDIAVLYDGLVALSPSPVFRLNRAVAHAMAYGAEVGLAQIDALDGLDEYHLFHAARADVLRRLDRSSEAEVAYTRARRLASNAAERQYLERRITECRAREAQLDDRSAP